MKRKRKGISQTMIITSKRVTHKTLHILYKKLCINALKASWLYDSSVNTSTSREVDSLCIDSEQKSAFSL